MKNKWILVGVILVLCLLTGSVGSSQAQGTEPPEEGAADTNESINQSVSSLIPIQGKLTDISGNPVPDGNYSITASLYEVDHGGTALCTDTQTIAVTKGLFTMNVRNCYSNVINGQQLWIGIKVGSDTEMSPRQPIYPVPYAQSLSPGATINYAPLIIPGDSVDIQGSISSFISWKLGHSRQLLPSGRENVGLKANVTSGDIAYGVSGSAETSWDNAESYGVYGYANATGSGAKGYGVYGRNESPNGYPVVGLQSYYGLSDIPTETFRPGGVFGGFDGVFGFTNQNMGFAVYGYDQSPSGGWAGYFGSLNGNGVHIHVPDGHVGYSTNGTKTAVVETDEGSRLLYSEESTGVWFSDYGFGELDNGEALINIDPLFAQTVNLIEPYHVFIQVYGDAEVYVSNRTPTSFEVHLRDGDQNVEFSYRIVAVRLGYEGTRLEAAPEIDAQERLEQSASSNP